MLHLDRFSPSGSPGACESVRQSPSGSADFRLWTTCPTQCRNSTSHCAGLDAAGRTIRHADAEDGVPEAAGEPAGHPRAGFQLACGPPPGGYYSGHFNHGCNVFFIETAYAALHAQVIAASRIVPIVPCPPGDRCRAASIPRERARRIFTALEAHIGKSLVCSPLSG